MAEEEQVQLLLLRGEARQQERRFDPVGMAVAHQDPLAAQYQQLFRGGVREEVTVARHLFQRDVRKAVPEPLPVPPAVPQVQDQIRYGQFHRPDHGRHGTVGVREYQNVHRRLLFHVCISIAQDGGFCNRRILCRNPA